MSWKDKFTFRDKTYVECEINGTQFRFYPNRMALLTEARDLSTPVLKAVSALFANESDDAGSSVTRHREGDFYTEDIKTSAASVEMIQFRQSQKDAAIDNLMSTIADERSKLLLGKLFMDSLRDDFEYKRERSAKDVESFLYGTEGDEYQGLDMPTLIQLFKGWMQANSKVFGNVGEKMVGAVKARLENQMAQSALASGEVASETSTNGDSSKTPSSLPSDSDSQPSI